MPHTYVWGINAGGINIYKYRIRINEYIRVKEIRLIGGDGEQIGVVPIEEGLRLAREASLDLVEVAPTAKPPVCRIMDYSKYKYEQEKRDKEARKKQKVIKVKEIKLRPKIGEHDYQVKLQHLQKFLNRKDKAKITMIFRGREMAHIDLGKKILERLATDLADIAEVEKEPRLEGRAMIMIMVPK